MSEQRDRLIADLVRPEIQSLSSYHVPDPGDMLKLDAMENPNAWPGELMDEWKAQLDTVAANRYPDPEARAVKEALRELMDLDTLQQKCDSKLDIIFGNGSDELIQIIAMSLANEKRCVMAPEPGFVMYGMIARFVGMPYQGVPLAADFSLDLGAFLDAIEQHDPAVIFLAVPNNPTGNVFAEQDVRSIIEASKGLVVLDEAYLAFTDSDLLALCAEYDNVVVMRTFSKVGLAGLRLGFLVGAEAWLTQFNKIRLPYNINVLTQASVAFALKHYATLEQQTSLLLQERDALFAQLQQIDSIETFPSEANFILVRCLKASARDVFESLKQAGILIKCLDGAHPSLKECLRLTVGLAEDNARLLAALKPLL